MTDSSKGLMPSEDEIRQILAQAIKENPSSYPAVVLRLELAHLMTRYFDKLNAEYNASVEKMVNKFQAEVDEFTKKMMGIIENKRDK
jgi:predicted oxidoreductase (fatty acid repression mutant protein)